MDLNPVELFTNLQSDLSCHMTDDSTTGFACRRLSASLLKKCSQNRKADAAERAITAFSSFRSLSVPTLPDLSLARAFVHRVLGLTIEDREVASGMKIGPGSVLTLQRETSTSGYWKILLSDLSCGHPDMFIEVLRLAGEFNLPLYSALLTRWSRGFLPTCLPYCKLITVPKQDDIDRCITLIPCLDAFYQQGVRSVIERRLRGIGLDIRTQPGVNQALARLGSMGHGLCTIDLKDASNSISPTLCEALLPPEWLAMIDFAQPPSYLIGGKVESRGRIAMSMGNAITFPWETLIFLALGYQAQRLSGVSTRINENLAVFGDDIVIDERSAPFLMVLLEESGFFPNGQKSFLDGDFRESCGADWLNGINVRGVYLRDTSSWQSLLSCRNLLEAWSYRHDVPLTMTLGYYDTCLESQGLHRIVPLSAPISSGIRDPAGCFPFHRGLQCSKVSVFMNRPVRRRAIPYTFERYRSMWIQSCLEGWVAPSPSGSVFINERPRSVGTRSLKTYYFHGNEPIRSEQWLYDKTRRTAGLIEEEFSSWAS